MIKNLCVNSCYFHSIIHGHDKGLEVIDNIFKTGAIKSPASLGINDTRYGCHKATDICLSKATKKTTKQGVFSCFDLYVSGLTSFIIDKDISKKQKIIKPRVLPVNKLFGNIERGNTTNLYDEYRTNDDIKLEDILGICIPYDKLVNDPFACCMFVVEEILMGYYNCLLGRNAENEIRAKGQGEDKLKLRKELIELYIEEVIKSKNKYGVDLPIYLYKENNNKKELVLR